MSDTEAPAMSQPDPIDEMVDGRGGIRPLWRSVLGVFAEFGEGELGERARRLDRVFDEEGGVSLRPGSPPMAAGVAIRSCPCRSRPLSSTGWLPAWRNAPGCCKRC